VTATHTDARCLIQLRLNINIRDPVIRPIHHAQIEGGNNGLESPRNYAQEKHRVCSLNARIIV
jgi:hypothetical protein